MVDNNLEVELELLDDDKKLIMELVTKKYFGPNDEKNTIQNYSVDNAIFDNEEYFYETGQLCKDDREKIIKLLFQEQFSHNLESGLSYHITTCDNNDPRFECEVETTILNINDDLKSPNINKDQIADGPRTISKEDRDSIGNILTSFNDKIVNEDGVDFYDMPTRPNSKQNSQERVLNPVEKNNVEIGIKEEYGKTTQLIRKHVHDGNSRTSSKKHCKNISVNNEKTNLKEISQYVEVKPGKNDYSAHTLDDAKTNFLEYFEQQDGFSVLDVLKKKSKEYYKGLGEITIKTTFKGGEETPSNCYNYNNMKSYHYQSPAVSNKCIIEENTFNFSMYKTPMNDTKGPFYIDSYEVSVDTYQDGLVDQWNPTQVLYELCSQCKWHPPFYVQHHYSLDEGFHYGVSVKDCHFVPANQGANKKLAKHYASTFFLHFLGFKFNFNDNLELALISTELYNRNDDRKYRSHKFNDALEYKNNIKDYKLKKRRSSTDDSNINQHYNIKSTQIHGNESPLTSNNSLNTETQIVLYDKHLKSKHDKHFPKSGMNTKPRKSQYNLPSTTMIISNENKPRGVQSMLTRVMKELNFMNKELTRNATDKYGRSGYSSNYIMHFNQEINTKVMVDKNKREEKKKRSRSHPNSSYDTNFKSGRYSSTSSLEVNLYDNYYTKKEKRRKKIKEIKKRDRLSSKSMFGMVINKEKRVEERNNKAELKNHDSSDSNYELDLNQYKFPLKRNKIMNGRSSSQSSCEIISIKENYSEKGKGKKNIRRQKNEL